MDRRRSNELETRDMHVWLDQSTSLFERSEGGCSNGRGWRKLVLEHARHFILLFEHVRT